jgi:hypothetical protein
VTFTVVIGNADAHGKNLSLLHPTAGMVTLAPLYDTVPTAMWPRLGDRAAMTINSKSALAAVTLDDIVAEAARWSLDRPRRRNRCCRSAPRGGGQRGSARGSRSDDPWPRKGSAHVVTPRSRRPVETLPPHGGQAAHHDCGDYVNQSPKQGRHRLGGAVGTTASDPRDLSASRHRS